MPVVPADTSADPIAEGPPVTVAVVVLGALVLIEAGIALLVIATAQRLGEMCDWYRRQLDDLMAEQTKDET